MTGTTEATKTTTAAVTAALCAADDHHQTLAQLAETTGLLHREVRAVLTALNSALEAPIIIPNGRRRRAWALTAEARERICVLELASLQERAQVATDAELTALSATQLRELIRALDPTREPPRGHRVLRGAVLKALLDLRAESCGPTCACGEGVDRVGDECTICEEARTPAPAHPTTPTRTRRAPRVPGAPRGPRKTDVAIDLPDEILAEIATAAAEAPSARAAQRAIGEVLWHHDGVIQIEVLRTLCRRHGRLSYYNFTINAKKEGWIAVRDERARILHWRLR